MKMLNEQELNLVNGGLGDVNPPSLAEYNDECHKREQFEQEKKRLEGLADIRLRAGDDALRAAMRLAHQEREIKEAMKR